MERFNCEDISAVLSGLLDDELDAETRRLAEAHLGRCASCRDVLNAAERADWSVRAVVATGEVWPAWLEARILGEIRSHDDRSGGDGLRLPMATELPSRRFTLVFAWSGWLAAGIAAAAALAALVGRPAFGPAPIAINDHGARAIDEPASSASATAPTRDGAAVAATEDDLVEKIHGSSLAAPDDLATAPLNDGAGAESGLSASASNSSSESDLNWFVDLTELGLNETRRRLVIARNSAREGMERGRDILDSIALAESERTASPGAATGLSDTSTTAEDDEDSSKPGDESTSMASVQASRPTPISGAALDNAMEPDGEIDRSNPVNPAEEAVYMASVLLDVVRQTEPGASFAELHRDINEVIESDDLLERLALAQNRVGPGSESAATIGQAWTALEWVAGPIEDDELESVQRLMSTSHLPERLETLSASLSR